MDVVYYTESLKVKLRFCILNFNQSIIVIHPCMHGHFRGMPLFQPSLSCVSSLFNPKSFKSLPTHSDHVFLPLPLPLAGSYTSQLNEFAQNREPCLAISTGDEPVLNHA